MALRRRARKRSGYVAAWESGKRRRQLGQGGGRDRPTVRHWETWFLALLLARVAALLSLTEIGVLLVCSIVLGLLVLIRLGRK
jgi:hypothetical protein